MKALFEMIGLERQTTAYKALRLQQILKLKKNVQRVQNVTENEYLNPFGLMDECEKRKLFHLSSGVPLQDKIADKI